MSAETEGNAGVLVGALIIVVFLGLTKLNLPLGQDQSLFGAYSPMMTGDAVLYEDIWDPKQPGVFLLFLLAGKHLASPSRVFILPSCSGTSLEVSL